ncbi:hypothetical protein SH1V18_47750 [Vallitalea longa]|uniref:Resolvase HTH domain-containing protein n=1 Tax=Vallitalea longa TaxID=2936439 RepID=A0A9W6DH47_9FIRM|nr:hypothetical protein [Vallitalea longa]GKX32295.1 hypothetical protein SH1V18_47750 [Vallitalea longa]
MEKYRNLLEENLKLKKENLKLKEQVKLLKQHKVGRKPYKITDREFLKIEKRIKNGDKIKDIAVEYGVSYEAIRKRYKKRQS